MDAQAFLCETCGYSLDAAEADGLCPECGHAVADSLPESRPGSAWQRRPGLVGWAKTIRATLFYTTDLSRSLSMSKGATGLLVINLIIASALIVAPYTGVFIGDWSRSARGSGPVLETLALVSAFLVQVLTAALILFLFTLFHVYGIVLLGRARGWRFPRRASWFVCCHASAAWIVAGVLPMIILAIYYILGTRIKLALGGEVLHTASGRGLTWQTLLGITMPIVGYLAGLALFEYIALKGARTRRYANLPQPGVDPTQPA